MLERTPLVVFSHLRWDFVYQRPQHLLSRFAEHRPVIVIEEPVHALGATPHWEISHPLPNLSVYRPHTPVPEWGFNDAQAVCLQPLLDQLMTERQIEHPLVWLYTPMALPLARSLNPVALVYDCMDELSAFDFAPPHLIEREAQVLHQADVVFTGGRSLYRAKKDRHPHVYCFPSSVDAAHFAQAKNGIFEPDDQTHLPHPRLGYFGVIDERMDLGLLSQLAATHPDWQIVMIGPVVKIDPADLPQHPNIHYLGQRPYSDLPAYLHGWDVCLLPFARNRATQFISPTKTLEYMAAEKPIVSTPITDVAEPYGEIVYLGSSAAEFVAACERALTAPAAERAQRTARMRAVLRRTSWDETAQAMHQIIAEAEEATVEVAGRVVFGTER